MSTIGVQLSTIPGLTANITNFMENDMTQMLGNISCGILGYVSFNWMCTCTIDCLIFIIDYLICCINFASRVWTRARVKIIRLLYQTISSEQKESRRESSPDTETMGPVSVSFCQPNSLAAGNEVRVEDVDPDEDDDLRHFRNDLRRHRVPGVNEDWMVPVSDKEDDISDSVEKSKHVMPALKSSKQFTSPSRILGLGSKAIFTTVCIVSTFLPVVTASNDSGASNATSAAFKIAAAAVAATAIEIGVGARESIVSAPSLITKVKVGSEKLTTKRHPGEFVSGLQITKVCRGSQLKVGDLIVSIDGKSAISEDDLAYGEDKERELDVIRASKAVILNGVVLLPPENGKAYHDDQIRLLGKQFAASTIAKGISNAGYYPRKTKIYKLLQNTEVVSKLDPQEQLQFVKMFFAIKNGSTNGAATESPSHFNYMPSMTNLPNVVVADSRESSAPTPLLIEEEEKEDAAAAKPTELSIVTAGVGEISSLVGEEECRDGEEITTIKVGPGRLGLMTRENENEFASGVEITEVKEYCTIKNKVDVGDVIVSVDGKYVESVDALKVGAGRERTIEIVRASKIVILNGVVLLPPENGKTYHDDQIKLLGKQFTASTIVNGISNAGYYPTQSKIYRLLQGSETTGLNTSEWDKFEEMVLQCSKRNRAKCAACGTKCAACNRVPPVNNRQASGVDTSESTRVPPTITPTNADKTSRENNLGGDTEFDRTVSSLLRQLSSMKNSLEPSTKLQTIADIVMKRMKEIQDGNDVVELSYQGANHMTFTHRYIILPQLSKCRSSSSDESKARYVRTKVNAMIMFFSEIVEQSTDHGQEMAKNIIRKMAEKYGYTVFNQNELTLLPEEVAVLREQIGTTTNGMYRLKSALEAIRPKLRGLLLPPCIKQVLARVDANDNFKNRTVYRQCIITKDGTSKGLRPFAFIERPWEAIQRIIEKTKVEGSYKLSQTWMKAQDKCVITMNADKGTDINLSIRCANKEGGNSMNDTYCIASVEGPVCECIETEMETIFNDEYPIRNFLQGLLDQTYFAFTIMAPNNQWRSIVFQPTPKSGQVCESRTIGVRLLEESTKESAVEFEAGVDECGPPKVSIPATAKSIDAKPVVKDDDPSKVVGIQFLVDAEVKYAKRFHSPLTLTGSAVDVMKCSLEQIIGFAPNDGKQQLICIGIPSNSCSYACPSCICHRNDFGHWPKRLWNAAVRLGLKSGPWPYKDVSMREGDWSFQKCLDRFKRETYGGNIAVQPKDEKDISQKTASVSKPIGLSVWPSINGGDVMHLSSGMINHTFNKIRKKLREFEADADFMVRMRQSERKVQELYQQLETSRQKMKDKKLDNLMIPLHRESVNLRKKMSKLMEKAKGLELALHYKENDGDLGDQEYVSILNIQKSNEQIEMEIEMHQEKMKEQWEEVKKHADESGYGHYIQLHKGLLSFYDGLVQFLSGSSKRPHGKLEFVFNNALEYVGGGQFSAENSGYDQTNGRGMNSLKNFDDVAKVCVLAYKSDPRFAEVERMFDEYKKLAKALFELTKYMKSQEMRDADKLAELIVIFLDKYEALFPNEPCYNKLHFVMWHLVEFVAQWGTCGRLSAESHESVHTSFEKAKRAVMKIVSTNKRFNTLFARMTLDLKDNIAELKRKVSEKMTGKTRGPYKTNNSSKRQDEVDVVAAAFGKTISFGEEEFIVLPCDGGRIHKEYIDQYVYVTTGRAPADWTRCFAESRLLSDAKEEQAKYATFHRVSN